MRQTLTLTGMSRFLAFRFVLFGLSVANISGCGSLQAPESTPKIFGGTPVTEGAWTNVVGLAFRHGTEFFIECTGTVIAPRLVLTAGHCLDEFIDDSGPQLRPGFSWDDLAVIPGNGFEGGAIPADTTVVRAISGFVHEQLRALPRGNADMGLLVLTSDLTVVHEVTAPSYVPLLSGINETQRLTAKGHEATMVGFGAREDQGRGVKYEVATAFAGREGAEALLGGNGKDSCNGDSGGPVFVRAAVDAQNRSPGAGPWFLGGVVSRGINLACGSGGIVTLTPDYLCWIEQKTGIDLGSRSTNHGCVIKDEIYSDKRLSRISFRNLCGKTSASPMQRHTIDALKLVFKADSCAEAAKKLDTATTIDLSGMRIRDLSPLAHAEALRTINLSANKLTDVSTLRTLGSLMTVDLSYNSIGDFSTLEPLEQSGLKVRGKFLQNTTFLKTRFRELCDNPAATPSQSKTIRALRSRFMTGDCDRANLLLSRQTELRIVNREIADLTPFEHLENLTSLDLTGNPVSDISPLATCSNLKTLDLTGTNVTDISPLVELIANGLDIRRATP